MKNSLLKFVAVLAMFVGFAGFVNAQAKDETLERISVKSLLASGLPVSIEFATVTKMEGDSILTYSIANKDAQKLEAVDISLIVFDANGDARGGEGWRQSINLTKNANADFSRRLKTKVAPGDRIVFFIHKAKAEIGQWEADPTKVVNAAKAFIAGSRYSLPEARFTKTK